MTYGVAVITASGLFTLLSSAGTLLGGRGVRSCPRCTSHWP